ncbi:type IV secretory system conjugative DNA transfer family protein [Sedimentibacter hydroxybenzoicus]|nr:type IV secretory system conjugative DNA transfer family protein [Sedimentibacter hydroxybenzoicus]
MKIDFDKHKSEITILITVLTVFQALLIGGLFLKKGAFIIFTIITLVSGSFSIVIENKKRLYISTILYIIYLLIYVNNILLGNLDVLLKIMLYVLFVVLFISYISVKEIDIIEQIEKIKPLLSLNFRNLRRDKPKKGDVCICKTKNKPVYIPIKDRFLHTLILGPTGCGKTSQSILPMINQDMAFNECGITVIEPKGDLAEKVYAMAQHYGRKVIYFNPTLDSCPTFNPLYGDEEDVVENMATTFKMLKPDSPQFFQDMEEQLIRNALKLLKRLKGNQATLIDLNNLMFDIGGIGKNLINNFEEHNKNKVQSLSLKQENEEIISYFKQNYFNENDQTFENTSGVRTQVAKVVSNKYLRKVLNPQNGKSDIDFSKHLEGCGIITISTEQGKLRDLGSFLGYFIILNFQSAVFKRGGDEDTRRPHFLYIDEFQTYANSGFSDMLTQGRSYRVASTIATQNRALIGMGSGKDGKDFIELVSTNARNVIIYPGGNYSDAKYYSDQFGEILTKRKSTGTSKQRFNILNGNSSNTATDNKSFSEQWENRIRPADIIYRPFGEIIYCIIKNNTIQLPNVGKVSFLSEELNGKLSKMVRENKEILAAGINPDFYRNEKGEFVKSIDEILRDNIKIDSMI